MARSRAPEAKQPDWPTEKTLRQFKQQLDELQKLKDRNHRQAGNDEDLWQQLTKAVFIHGFGEASHNLDNFNRAAWAGKHNLMGISDYQAQNNFQERIEKFEVAVISSIKELEAILPETAARGVYEAGDDFTFYRDLKDIFGTAAKEVFIVDNFLNTEFFELYVHPIRPGVPVRILSDEIRGNLETVARRYSSRGSFELRSSRDVHDRHVFVDGRGWMIGQSIKDAAKRKPTYMVEIGAALVVSVQRIYEDIWSRGTIVVEG